jgi:hypothetical protein
MKIVLAFLLIARASACEGSWSESFASEPVGWTIPDFCLQPQVGEVVHCTPAAMSYGDQYANGGMVMHMQAAPCSSTCPGCHVTAGQLWPPYTSYGIYSMIAKAPQTMNSLQPTLAYFFMSLFNGNTSQPDSAGDQIYFEFAGTETSCGLNFHEDINPWGQPFQLWFDPVAEFATYTINWQPYQVTWSVNNQVVCQFDSKAPGGPMGPYFILRPMSGYDGTPTAAQVQSAQYQCS